MKSNELKIKQLNQIIKDFNSIPQSNGKTKWVFSARDITNQLKIRHGYDDEVRFVHNCLKYLTKNNMIEKIENETAKYFGFIKERYFSPMESLSNFPYSNFKINKNVISMIEDINKLGNNDSKKIFSQESLFTTIVEYGTLNEANIHERSKNIVDPEIIEKNNIENLYDLFLKEKINSYIDKTFLMNIHSRLMSGLENSNRMGGKPGRFTAKQNYISGGFIPCTIDNKESELDKFIIFYNEQPKDINDAIIRLAIISYWFAGIHIFEDGNSRTGRFLLSYYMFVHNIVGNMSFTISKALNTLGGKDEFVKRQIRSWKDKSLESYVDWFINDLVNEQWLIQMKKWYRDKND